MKLDAKCVNLSYTITIVIVSRGIIYTHRAYIYEIDVWRVNLVCEYIEMMNDY